MNSEDESAVKLLYQNLIKSWNTNDAAGFAVGFLPDGQCIGFDGSEYATAQETQEQLGAIFKDHTVATYVYKVREVAYLTPDVALLRAVASMYPPEGTELNPERNVIHTLIAVRKPEGWRIALYQNTPARYDGRPEAVQALTEELGQLAH